MDFDPENEFALVVALDNNNRDLQFPTPNTGEQVWNQACDCIQVYDGNTWTDISSLGAISATNGINIGANTTIKFGGALVEPTKLTTDATNTLSIDGLQETTSTIDKNIVLIDTNSGVISRTPLGNVFQEEVTLTIAANDGQNQFATPSPITDDKKINIYRNGVRIGFTVVNNNTMVELEPAAVCYAGDEIRIIQFTN